MAPTATQAVSGSTFNPALASGITGGMAFNPVAQITSGFHIVNMALTAPHVRAVIDEECQRILSTGYGGTNGGGITRATAGLAGDWKPALKKQLAGGQTMSTADLYTWLVGHGFEVPSQDALHQRLIRNTDVFRKVADGWVLKTAKH
jgi:hypothetical protein